MNCTNCGNALRPGDQFCLKCGGPAPPSNMETSGAPSSSTPPPEDYKTHQEQAQSHPPQGDVQPPQPAQAYPPQQPQTYPPSDALGQARTLLGLAMVFSLIGGIMLMVLEFGGWHNRDDYHGTEVWGSVGPFESPLGFLAFLAVGGLLFYCSFTAYQGFSSKTGLRRGLVMRGFVISLVVFIIVIVGGAALLALTWDNDSQWLDAGFYGGAIGSLLTSLLFWMVLKNTPHQKIDKRAGYGAPYPQYHQAQAPQVARPSQLSQQKNSQEPQVTGDAGGEDEQPVHEKDQIPKEESQPETQKPAQEPQPVQQQYRQQPQQQQYQQSYQQPYYPQYQQQYQQPQQQTYPCRTCGRPLRYVPEYSRWYCDSCRQYV